MKTHTTWTLNLVFILAIALLPSFSFAQDEQAADGADGGQGPAPAGSIYSFHVGPLLPNQFPGMTEIMPVVGGRYAMPMRKGHTEFGIASANSKGVSYYNGSTSFRGEFTMDDMTALVYAGLDIHYYKPVSETYRFDYGGHVGGGFLSHIGDRLYFRTDMKFNLNPGTALYIGFGVEWRMPGGESQDEGQ